MFALILSKNSYLQCKSLSERYDVISDLKEDWVAAVQSNLG